MILTKNLILNKNFPLYKIKNKFIKNITINSNIYV